MPNQLPQACAVTCLDDYKIHVSFTDGHQGIIDIQPLLSFGVFSRLTDISLFLQARVAFGCVEWPTGIDLDPEWLYQRISTSQVAERTEPYQPQ